MIEFDADGRYRGMTSDELEATRTLQAQMRGDWLYNLTSTRPEAREQAGQKLAEAAETFKGFTQAQKAEFLKQFYLKPADLPTAVIVATAFGLASAPTDGTD